MLKVRPANHQTNGSGRIAVMEDKVKSNHMSVMAKKSVAEKQEERRLEVLQATWNVISKGGLENASLRAIAEELNCTTGVVTHYFRNKDAILQFGLDAIGDEVTKEIQTIFSRPVSSETILEVVDTMLPLDQDSQQWQRVWMQLMAAALIRPDVHKRQRERHQLTRMVVRGILSYLVDHKQITRSIDLDDTTDVILALSEGISAQCALNPDLFTPDRQRHLVRQTLQDILGIAIPQPQ